MNEANILLGLFIAYTFIYGRQMKKSTYVSVRERVIPQAVISTIFLVLTYVAVLSFDGLRASLKHGKSIISLIDTENSLQRTLIVFIFVVMMSLCILYILGVWSDDLDTISTFIRLLMFAIATVAYVCILLYCSTPGTTQKASTVRYENTTTQHIG